MMVHFWPAWSWLTGSLALLWMPAAFISAVWFWQHREETSGWLKARITYPRTGYVAPPSYHSEEPGTSDPVIERILDWLERHPAWISLGRRAVILWVGIFMMEDLLSTFQVLPKVAHVLSSI